MEEMHLGTSGAAVGGVVQGHGLGHGLGQEQGHALRNAVLECFVAHLEPYDGVQRNDLNAELIQS